MQVKLFTIPVHDSGVFTEELNQFLRGHKIITVENELLTNNNGVFWAFCVKYIGGDVPTLPHQSKKERIDYKSVLDEATFKIFYRLREIRKELASEDAIPIYMVFLDEELANIARLPEITPTTIQTIKGIGEKKAERFAERLIQKMSMNNTPNETR